MGFGLGRVLCGLNLFLDFRIWPETMSFRLGVFVLILGLKRRSFNACQLFTWSSLKRHSFWADLAKTKHISMMMCHLTAKINHGGVNC